MGRRVKQIKRKKPLIVIHSEGGRKSSEYYYFLNFQSRDVRIQFSTGNNTDPKGMLENFKAYIENEDLDSEDDCKKFLLIDTDLNENRIKEIISIQKECQKYGIEIILSAPTFEIWYIMHFRNNKLVFSSSANVKKEVGKLLNREYEENMNVYEIIKDRQSFAKETAIAIEKKNHNQMDEIIYNNPISDIFKVIDAIEEYKNRNEE